MAALIISVDGLELSAGDRQRLSSSVVVGVILFAYNYSNPTQLAALTASIKAIRKDLLISVDHEGGRVQRFVEGFTAIPAANSWQKPYASDQVRTLRQLADSATTMIEDLRDCGVDMSFTPCLDLDWGKSTVIQSRSFAADPALVSTLARSYIAALKAVGMPVTAKHFPGHGYVRADSHEQQPIDPRSWGDIKQSDAVPFIDLMCELDLLMPAHIVYPEVDDQPVTFSSVWLQDILRDELGYTGLVITDDLSMVGASIAFPDIVERINAAINAGCDLTLLCHEPASVNEILRRETELVALSDATSEKITALSRAVSSARALCMPR